MNPMGRMESSNIEMPKSEIHSSVESIDTEKLDAKIKLEKTGLLPRNGGEWTDAPGNSIWNPDCNVEPGDRNGTNPEHKIWAEILSEYDIKGIPFNDGEPDFTEIAKGTVEIDDFTDDRASNFDQADEKMAEQRGCSPEDVAKWRKETDTLGTSAGTVRQCKRCLQRCMETSLIPAVFLSTRIKTIFAERECDNGSFNKRCCIRRDEV